MVSLSEGGVVSPESFISQHSSYVATATVSADIPASKSMMKGEMLHSARDFEGAMSMASTGVLWCWGFHIWKECVQLATPSGA